MNELELTERMYAKVREQNFELSVLNDNLRNDVRRLDEAIEEYRDENADLRKQLNHADETNGRLVAENDRLRELLTTILNEGRVVRSCADCDIREECANQPGRWKMRLFVIRVKEKASELGIEVDGWT